jgi:polynucleotide 5'-hydroxyl-kinase GRC3/NOL9
MISLTNVGSNELEVRLDNGQFFHVLGQCNIKVESGTIDVMGYRLEEGKNSLLICSPKSTSLVCVFAVSSAALIRLTSVNNNLASIETLQSAFHEIFSFTQRPADITGCWVIQEPSEGLRLFQAGEGWDPIATELVPHNNSTTFVCGNRKVGKSTFCRHLINRMLNYHQRVAFIDFDCGQSELTPPGFVAYTILDAPLTSPNYESMARHYPTESRFFGALSPSDNPNRYLSCCKDLWLSSRHTIPQNTPVVINMLGWVSGLGLAAMTNILHNIKPTHIIAFGEKPPIGEDYVSKALYGRSGFPQDSPLNENEQSDLPAIAYIPPIVSSITQRVSPADTRNLLIWSYFSFKHTTLNFDFRTPLSQKQPFAINTSPLSINFLTKVSSVGFWAAFNCSVVALVSNTSFTPGSVSYDRNQIHRNVRGLGFIRGVKPNDKVIHLVTPLPLEIVKTCNTIIVSALQLPPAMFTQSQQYDGPYLSYQASFKTSGAAPRKVRHNINRVRDNN